MMNEAEDRHMKILTYSNADNLFKNVIFKSNISKNQKV